MGTVTRCSMQYNPASLTNNKESGKKEFVVRNFRKSNKSTSKKKEIPSAKKTNYIIKTTKQMIQKLQYNRIRI